MHDIQVSVYYYRFFYTFEIVQNKKVKGKVKRNFWVILQFKKKYLIYRNNILSYKNKQFISKANLIVLLGLI